MLLQERPMLQYQLVKYVLCVQLILCFAGSYVRGLRNGAMLAYGEKKASGLQPIAYIIPFSFRDMPHWLFCVTVALMPPLHIPCFTAGVQGRLTNTCLRKYLQRLGALM
eukprot:scaffold97664_cov18-Tisochrysis_lutea.AAC.3